MLERILKRTKNFFREKIEKLAEDIYWRKYKRDAINYYRGGFSVSTEAQESVDYIIRWAEKKDPIERFLSALREMIGFEVSVSIQKMRVVHEEDACFRIIFSLLEVGNIFLELNGEEAIMEIQQNQHFGRKLVYTTHSWNRINYEYESVRGTHVKCDKYDIELNGFLNETEKYNFSMRAVNPYSRGKCLYLQTKEIIKTIEAKLDQREVACKVYPIYKMIKDSISSIYNLNDCSTSISALSVSATFLHGDLVRYEQEDGMISIIPYKHYLQKEFYTENGAGVIFENKKYKNVNVKLEEVDDILDKAKEAFDKLENLDF